MAQRIASDDEIAKRIDDGYIAPPVAAFCYGPKSCPAYRPGPTRKVQGRNRMSWEEDDWVDEEAVAHRGPDE